MWTVVNNFLYWSCNKFINFSYNHPTIAVHNRFGKNDDDNGNNDDYYFAQLIIWIIKLCLVFLVHIMFQPVKSPVFVRYNMHISIGRDFCSGLFSLVVQSKSSIKQIFGGWWEHSIVTNVLDCNNVVGKFKPQLLYYIHFQTNSLGKGMNPFIVLAMG